MELGQLQVVVGRGLFATADLWPPLQRAHGWVQQAAQVLANVAEADAPTVAAAYHALVTQVGTLAADPAVAAWAAHFYRVSMRYWSGLFHCYTLTAVPRTNNALEQYFGTARHHERRATGHKRPTTTVTVRGSVRVVAAVATRLTLWSAADLRLTDLPAWRRVRAHLEARQATRRAAHCFRHDPATYLAHLEAQLLQ